jgi:hypothetical protein
MGSVVFNEGISVAYRRHIDHSLRLEHFGKMSDECVRLVEQKPLKSIKFQIFDHLPLFSDFIISAGNSSRTENVFPVLYPTTITSVLPRIRVLTWTVGKFFSQLWSLASWYWA